MNFLSKATTSLFLTAIFGRMGMLSALPHSARWQFRSVSLCASLLKPTSDSILSAGKSIGLLRILDDRGDINPDVLRNLGTTQLPGFKDFLTEALKALTDESDSGGNSPLEAFRRDRSLTIDDFTLILRERLLPPDVKQSTGHFWTCCSPIVNSQTTYLPSKDCSLCARETRCPISAKFCFLK